MNYELAILCVECGPAVRIDEDGCCAMCGATAMGTWLDKAHADPVAACARRMTKLEMQRDSLRAELEAVRRERDEAVAQLHAAESANRALSETLVEHTELNGHVDLVEECRDWLSSEAFDGETGGKLDDYIQALGVVLDQFDKQRRSRNWYEVAYTAGKQKLIESAVDKALSAARDAARVYAARVNELGAVVPDTQEVMATAGPIGVAQAELWLALGIYNDEEIARLNAEDERQIVEVARPLDRLRSLLREACNLAEPSTHGSYTRQYIYERLAAIRKEAFE